MTRGICLIFIAVTTSIIISSCKSATEPEIDYNYSIQKVWWSDTIDNDKDGFSVSKILNFNVHLEENVTRTVVARIYYKLTDAPTYSFYNFTEEYEIEGIKSPSSMQMIIGIPNKELVSGLYDFQIELYEKSNNRVEAKVTIEDSIGAVLSNQAFEELKDDQIYTITPWWRDAYDRNGNGYARYATLGLDIDVGGNLEKKLTAYVYYKEKTSDKFRLYLTSEEFTIRGIQKQDSINLLIGEEGKELSRGEYDFRVEFMETDFDYPAAVIDNQTSDVLNDVKFETHEEDSYFYTIVKNNLNWINLVDNDADGYTSSRKLVFDVDVDKNEYRSILAKIFVKHPDSTNYNYYGITNVFRIYGSNPFDTIQIPIGTASYNLDSAKYNFILTVYEDVPDSLKIIEAEVGGYEEGDVLYQQSFETAAQDSLR